MVTSELLKNEIDKVNEQYFPILYNIIKSFEVSTISVDVKDMRSKKHNNLQDWHQFISTYAGCLEGMPIERGDQGKYEVREEIE